MSESFNSRIKRNREILSCIIDAILLCGKQNLAIRGHEEKHSNFVALLHMRAKDNIVLADHLSFADPQKKYTSPDIQNELIGLCADQIISTLVQACNDSRYFGFMSDEATDCSIKEQASICQKVFFFKENLEQNAVVREEIGRRQKLKTLCETRWASRSESLHTFLTAFKVITDSLENLEQHGDSKARSYACSIKKFDFIITLVAAQSILQPLVPVSEMLQRKSVDLFEAVSESRVVIEQLNRKRNSIEA
ncbi:unnamed protein product [Mytilus coruscus]|uniref:DUF4371 domain-containing protein n=1 Tax=Mytilus coruscus TaxID=42192 RepID=A0A6J8D661_MYTCO|nr:unnamed protein product [Mytilus coruscus]